MGVINLAHGELIMLGAYTTYVVQLIFKLPAFEPVYNLYVLVAIPLAWGVSLILQQFVRSVPLATAAGVVLALVVGFSLPLVLPAPLLEGPRARLVRAGCWATSALAGVLLAGGLASQISRIARATSRNVDVTAPQWMRGGLEWADLTLPVPRLVIIVMTVVSVLGVTLFLNRSVWGTRIRAVTQNRSMSDCLGIRSGLAGIAGVAVSLLGSVGPNVGGSYIVGCFMVVVLGGVGNLFGAVLASFAIGLLTDLIGAGRLLTIWPDMPAPLAGAVNFFATTSMAQVMVFALIVVFLQFRPAGLFPQKGRMVEA